MGVFLRREIVMRDMSWKSEGEIERDKEKGREGMKTGSAFDGLRNMNIQISR